MNTVQDGSGRTAQRRKIISHQIPTNPSSLFSMKKHLIRLGFLALVICAGFGCSTTLTQQLNHLSLGMTQEQVKDILGDEYITTASTTDTSGAHLQLWEYTDSSDRKNEHVYCVYFKDGKLAQWGEKGKVDFPVLNTPK
jgi:hypothetical protein